jgi:hypothetical protein
MGEREIANYIREIEAERDRLRTVLRGKEREVIERRPPNDDWSIVEHVRHLLFAEQLHLGRFQRVGFAWSPIGLGGHAGRNLSEVGQKPTTDVVEVLAEWDAIHAATREAVTTAAGDIERALWRNHRHLRTHIQVIEKLLRRWDA